MSKIISMNARGLTTNSRTLQSSLLLDIRQNKRFGATPMKFYQVSSSNLCAMACSREPFCRSFTFCGRLNCFLHHDDVYSTTEGVSKLVEDTKCKYIGMKKTDFPTCRQGSTFVSMVQETNLVDCNIYQKRLDREWTSWEHTS